MITIKGVVDRVIYHSPENAFVILSVSTDKGRVKAKGTLTDTSVLKKNDIKGVECELVGRWKKDPKWGYEFVFENGRINDIDGIFFFLTKMVKGLGENLSRALIKEYGEEKLTWILDNKPEQLTEFKGIKEKKLAKIISSWKKYREIKALAEFFGKCGVNVTGNMVLRVYNNFKEKYEDIAGEIRKNPYILTEVRGIGFKTADKIALGIGIDPYSETRINALIDYILFTEASDNGNTYLTWEQMISKAEEYIYRDDEAGLDSEKLPRLIVSVVKNNEERYFFNEHIVSLKKYRNHELFIERYLREKAGFQACKVSDEEANSFINKKEREMGFTFSPEQREAIKTVATGGVSLFVLCGYAGTGKSTLSKVILDFFAENFFDKDSIVCCAFTGMASKRIGDVTGYKSQTIHSLLGFNGTTFEYNAQNPLPYSVVLLDEASMVNVDIFYRLLRAIKKDTVFIMVGDDAQLPPIGAGNVFNDLLKKEWVPKVKLTRIYRQSSDSVISYFAGFIRDGKVPRGCYKAYRDWEFIVKDIDDYFRLKDSLSEKQLKELRESHYNEILETMIDRIKETIKRENLKGKSKIWNIQVITAMKNTILGTKNLNIILRKVLNGDAEPVLARRYEISVNDKVIHLKNKNMLAVERPHRGIIKNMERTDEKNSHVRVYNGSLGLIYAINEEDEEFYVAYPEFPDKLIVYSFDDFGDIIDYGYALTIHKTQGNQFEFVFVPVINSFYVMLNSKLMYTGITRAIKRITIIGQKYAFKRGCTNIDETVRQTHLSLDSIGV